MRAAQLLALLVVVSCRCVCVICALLSARLLPFSQYCPAGTATPVDCFAHSTAPGSSTSADDCTCKPSYFRSGSSPNFVCTYCNRTVTCNSKGAAAAAAAVCVLLLCVGVRSSEPESDPDSCDL